MNADSQGLSIATPSPSVNPFKFYILHKTEANETIPCNFRKRRYKHIHSLVLQSKSKSFLNKIPRPKTLHSVGLDNWQPGMVLRFVKKFVKPLRKYIRDLHGGAAHWKVHMLLPLVTNLRVVPRKEDFRFALHSGIEKLDFALHRKFPRKINAEELFKKFKSPLSRSLGRTKNLKSLSVTIPKNEIPAAKLLLEMIDRNLALDSVEECSLSFASNFSLDDLKKFQDLEASKSKIFAKLTHLSCDQVIWCSFLMPYGSLTNLRHLKLELFLKETSSDPKGLFCFHNLQKLKNFSFSFTADSEPFEKEFFENFSLPPSLEDLSLTLNRLKLNEKYAFSNQFFQRIQEAKGVRALNLKITENADNSAFTAKFTCLLIKCFHNLETLECHNHKERFRANNTRTKPLDFLEFWTAIAPSRETLQSISLNINEVSSPEEENIAFEAGFPRLKTLILKDSISSGTELSKFCQKTFSLRKLILWEVKLQDEDKLKAFLDDVKYIPEEGNFELHLNCRNLTQKSLIDCLKKYIEDVNVKGRFQIYFKTGIVEDGKAFAEILKQVVEKGCFETFHVMSDVNGLFTISKRKVIQARESLGFSESE